MNLCLNTTARIVIRNALFFGKAKSKALNVPWCTYTIPEVARVGLNEEEARQQGINVTRFVKPLCDVDRAILDQETEGFVSILTKKNTDQIIGCTIVATHAGDLISQISTAMAAKFGLSSIAQVIFPYPTQAEAIQKIGDDYNRTRLTPIVKKLFKVFMQMNR